LYIALYGEPTAELQSVTCHMGPCGVSCHPTQVNAPCLKDQVTSVYVIVIKH